MLCTTMAWPLPTQAVPNREQHALNKKKLSKSDVRDKLVLPAMERAGDVGLEQIFGRYPLCARDVAVRGSTSRHDPSTVRYADYTLLRNATTSLGTVEAKTKDQAMGTCMPQAILAKTLMATAIAQKEAV